MVMSSGGLSAAWAEASVHCVPNIYEAQSNFKGRQTSSGGRATGRPGIDPLCLNYSQEPVQLRPDFTICHFLYFVQSPVNVIAFF